MLSRRELLTALAAAPLLGPSTASSAPELDFLEEPHPLASESARGYRSLSTNRAGWIIAPAVRDITPDTCSKLFRRVHWGAWLVLESGLCFSSEAHAKQQLQLLRKYFGLEILPPIRAHSYVSYSWPVKKLVRTFHAVTPIVCSQPEAIATVQGLPVCLKKQLGNGCIIYLGSMLGPGLMAEERESLQVGNALILSA